MARVLILFAHPALEKSRVHQRLLRQVPDLPGLTFHDLYEAYPDFAIDVRREQELLLSHDLVLLQHPFYWYSTPPIVKQWEDLVLEHGWAYGSQGNALRGKIWLHVVTTGGSAAAYAQGGYNRHTVRELLYPLEQTARLCKMTYLPPYLIQGTHRLDEPEIEIEAARYHQLLVLLLEDRLDLAAADGLPALNPLVEAALSGEVAA